ncbi:MAG: right-handed parallel beta-helix repeat-containing protein [Patescibacteria group bacterium]
MKIRLSLISLATGSAFVLLFGLVQPSWASGDYYVNANSADKSDDNSCRSTSAPCASLNGVISKILESATPQNSTVYAQGTFTESVLIGDTELEGLTLTWMNKGTRPVVNAAGEQMVIIISFVDNVSIKHFDLQGSQNYGIYAYGSSDTHIQNLTIQDCIIHDLDADTTAHYGILINSVDDALIKENTIHSIGSTNTNADIYATAYAIYVQRSDRPHVINNMIRDFTVDVTFTEENSYVYPLVSGVYVYEADGALIKNNEIKDIVSKATQSYASGYLYSFTYGIFLQNSLHSTISRNTLRRPKIRAVSNADGTTPYAYLYGIYAILTDDTVISRNKILNPSVSAQVLDDEGSQAYFYGIFTDSIGQVNVTRNTIRDASAKAINGSGSPVLYGLYINDVEQPYVANNRLIDLETSAEGTGGATTYAMRISDSPMTDIVHNRIENFTAAVTADDANNDSLGIYIDYNSSADILNNLIYFTESATQHNIDGIVVDSAQADPVRIFHNTMLNMRTCLQVENGAVLEFENNLCALSTSGAYGVQIDGDAYDLASGFISNYNLFYNSAEEVLMNDLAVGILSWSDWRSGEYKQDKKSVKQNPQLNVSDPTKKGYLHLKADSPAMNAGDADVNFGTDAVMNGLLGADWDNQVRPKGATYDIGADEFTL